jgi:pimeloyl-ACP methyl ester carboxylesterase
LLKLEGKIGVFGRSIGGITACHLAGKYNDLVDLLLIDRSMDELMGVL